MKPCDSVVDATTASVPSDVLDTLRKVGWCRLSSMNDADYRGVIERLGDPWCETIVEAKGKVRSCLWPPEFAPFHTDYPAADFVAWRCETPGVAGPFERLVDGYEALRACGEEITRLLHYVFAEVFPTRESFGTQYPILRNSPFGQRLFFAPWIKPIFARWSKPAERVQALPGAFAALAGEIQRLQHDSVEDVQLSEGEVLVIDNSRMLHAQGPLAPSSSRCWRRFWITRREPGNASSLGWNITP